MASRMPQISADPDKKSRLQRFYVMLDSIYSGVLLMTDEGQVEFVNQAFCDYNGLKESPVELIGTASPVLVEKIKHAHLNADRAAVRIREILQRGEPIRGEEFAMQGGRTATWDFIPLKVDGRSCGRLWLHHDITDRKRAEEESKESELRYRKLFGNRLIGVAYCQVILDESGIPIDYKFLDVNDTFAKYTGLEKDKVIGYTAREVFPGIENSSFDFIGVHGKVGLTGEEAAFEVFKDFLRRWYSVEVYSPKKGYFVSLLRDITEAKETDESLRKSEARFRLLAQTAEKLLRSPDPQSVVNELCAEVMRVFDCQVFFNYLVDELTGSLRLNACAGIPKKEAKQIEWLDFGVAVCGCVAQSGERMIVEDIQRSTDLRTDLVRSYGVQAYCCHPLRTHDRLIGTLSFGTRTRPRFTGFEVEVMRTIADQVAFAMQRIQTENSLRELNSTLEDRVEERTAEVNAMASQLRELASELTQTEQRERQRVAKILHDHIQQILVAAKLQTAALVNRQLNNESKASAQLVSDLIDRTISASRDLTAELSPPILYDAGLGPALQWLARNFQEKHGLKVEVIFDSSGEPSVEDVRVFLFDAIREVLFNVVKHSGAQKAHVECFRGKDDRVHAVISDEGKGFDPKRLQTGERSEGFGLFSIQQRLKHLGGRLEIDSAPGRGTGITLIAPPFSAATQLPLTAMREPSPVTPKEGLKTGKIRVVLADDHHIMRGGLAQVLRLEPDIEVVGEAANGVQAINLAHPLRPDVLVMDVSMPVLNGIEATIEIRRDMPDLKVIGLSMHEEGELSSAMRQAGAVSYVTKGGPPEALVGAIRKAASKRS